MQRTHLVIWAVVFSSLPCTIFSQYPDLPTLLRQRFRYWERFLKEGVLLDAADSFGDSLLEQSFRSPLCTIFSQHPDIFTVLRQT